MKKIFFLMIALGLLISACGSFAQPSVPSGAEVNPSPISEKDLRATSDALVQQTLQAMPTPTLQPSKTPVVVIETLTVAPSPTVNVTATETQNSILLTLTATLGTGTPFINTPGPGTFTFTPTTAPISGASATPTGEITYPQTYGTMPPNLPSGKVTVSNQAKTQATVSLQCTTKDGYYAEVNFPVGRKSKIGAKIPSGSCAALVWVDGKKFSTSFRLAPSGNVTVTITSKGVSAK